ncbi:hypothetical protein PGTUg99_021106 [Puccinia graminis f. sp. tritici]|uniref:ABC transmembrane type-1 domain-containing protein n=1 Tax=Puccinia graminis f. sp. tritici TaxID=56615 RepID=A0A5B0LJ85_PUCGR|nr:hypothetical protein PGTUg99_021106 [Puccinia graminis f. sp. tritici]
MATRLYPRTTQRKQVPIWLTTARNRRLIYANVFSRLTFGWMTPMMKLGKSQYLTEDDLWMLPREDQTDALTNRLHQTWRRQISRASSSPSLIRAIAQAYGGPYLLAALFKLIQDVLQFTQPQLLRRLLSFADSFSPGSQPEPVYRGYMIAGLMFSCGFTQNFILAPILQPSFNYREQNSFEFDWGNLSEIIDTFK